MTTMTTITTINPITTLSKSKRIRANQTLLNNKYFDDPTIFEIGVDEAGRGPLFGRVYSAAVVLPKEDTFEHFRMKDSKKFHSKKQIEEVAEYIKQNAIAWYVSFEDEKTIDKINILQSTQKAMHSAILEVRNQINKKIIKRIIFSLFIV